MKCNTCMQECRKRRISDQVVQVAGNGITFPRILGNVDDSIDSVMSKWRYLFRVTDSVQHTSCHKVSAYLPLSSKLPNSFVKVQQCFLEILPNGANTYSARTNFSWDLHTFSFIEQRKFTTLQVVRTESHQVCIHTVYSYWYSNWSTRDSRITAQITATFS